MLIKTAASSLLLLNMSVLKRRQQRQVLPCVFLTLRNSLLIETLHVWQLTLFLKATARSMLILRFRLVHVHNLGYSVSLSTIHLAVMKTEAFSSQPLGRRKGEQHMSFTFSLSTTMNSSTYLVWCRTALFAWGEEFATASVLVIQVQTENITLTSSNFTWSRGWLEAHPKHSVPRL